ncbi:hypothetical protein SASPL_124938 [Salvia splendens]|uniref:Uncharacterized protein n=1 Tax=Salvia splendens TaxID=180675 RepID=A0A8X8XG82_SALSN|nr:hypothetical protein SASPL_124938 [Salvia splendens]
MNKPAYQQKEEYENKRSQNLKSGDKSAAAYAAENSARQDAPPAAQGCQARDVIPLVYLKSPGNSLLPASDLESVTWGEAVTMKKGLSRRLTTGEAPRKQSWSHGGQAED